MQSAETLLNLPNSHFGTTFTGSVVPLLFSFLPLNDSLASKGDPLWVFHENFFSSHHPKGHAHTHTHHARMRTHTLSPQQLAPTTTTSKRFFFAAWLVTVTTLWCAAHVRSRPGSSQPADPAITTKTTKTTTMERWPQNSVSKSVFPPAVSPLLREAVFPSSTPAE